MLCANVADQADDFTSEDACDLTAFSEIYVRQLRAISQRLDVTLGVGAREVQLLDLCSPWHGRQHLEGLLAVNLLADADAEL